MTSGKSPASEDAFRSGASFCKDRVSARSIYALLYRESHRLFPDEMGGLDFDYAGCRRDDDDAAPGKPACDWDDAAGQDLARRDDGKLHIARRVAPDRVISIVDPEARHGHKTAARGFDGYKGHVAIDPDSELITATAVTPGNAADGSAAETLLADVLPAAAADAAAVAATPDASSAATSATASPVEVFGDASYGTAHRAAAVRGPARNVLEEAQVVIRADRPAPDAPLSLAGAGW